MIRIHNSFDFFLLFNVHILSPVVIYLFQLFINNEWHKSKSGKTFGSINPTTEQNVAEIQCAGKEDVDIAVQAARTAFKLVEPPVDIYTHRI